MNSNTDTPTKNKSHFKYDFERTFLYLSTTKNKKHILYRVQFVDVSDNTIIFCSQNEIE